MASKRVRIGIDLEPRTLASVCGSRIELRSLPMIRATGRRRHDGASLGGRARRDRKRFEDRVKEEDNGGNVDEKHAKVIEYKSKGDVGDGKVQFGGTTDEKRSLGNVKENEKALVERGQCDVLNLVHNKQPIFGMTPPIPSLSFGYIPLSLFQLRNLFSSRS
ncbi:U4/U6 small nuclear ribonucleoprotein Prp3 [Cucumis melo var. makuwa]|uniref:U4/U6 small nuclear ribonucleoprotein Prp3 n=1 Tax=Cucumis melo var. makuwa TaxID=1194695 RepID=A0A5A7TWT4_CUCMM|nr:U4/U6 small nuclear ribonucleoprotein Prp3 [Cucumis melo var. makuwa]